jgi:nucleotidyltransferase/DNA polymerase involved in DNA repair
VLAVGQLLENPFHINGDMSRRVMNVLQRFTPELEIYSIDEAFLNLAGFEGGGIYRLRADYTQRGQTRNRDSSVDRHRLHKDARQNREPRGEEKSASEVCPQPVRRF